MLYTVIPQEYIFGSQSNTSFEEIQISNQIVQVVRSDNSFTVNRLISTDPQSYLDKRFQPGRRIKMF